MNDADFRRHTQVLIDQIAMNARGSDQLTREQATFKLRVIERLLQRFGQQMGSKAEDLQHPRDSQGT